MKNYIIDPAEIPGCIEKDETQVWVCSYGGSGTNLVADYLEAKGFRVRTKSWDALLCHYEEPVHLRRPLKAIYIYGDPVLAFKSMVARGDGYYDVNQRKLNNDPNATISPENLMGSMIHQFNKWTEGPNYNIHILVIKYESLFEEGKKAISDFLSIDISDFPDFKPRRSVANDGSLYDDVMDLYRIDIDRINDFSKVFYRQPEYIRIVGRVKRLLILFRTRLQRGFARAKRAISNSMRA